MEYFICLVKPKEDIILISDRIIQFRFSDFQSNYYYQRFYTGWKMNDVQVLRSVIPVSGSDNFDLQSDITVLRNIISGLGYSISTLRSHISYLGSDNSELGKHIQDFGMHISALGSHIKFSGTHILLLQSHIPVPGSHILYLRKRILSREIELDHKRKLFHLIDL